MMGKVPVPGMRAGTLSPANRSMNSAQRSHQEPSWAVARASHYSLVRPTGAGPVK